VPPLQTFHAPRLKNPGSRSVVLKLYKHTEPLRSFPSFFQTSFLPSVTESKNGLHVSDHLRRTPKTAPSNLRGSIEASLRNTALERIEKYLEDYKLQINNGLAGIGQPTKGEER